MYTTIIAIAIITAPADAPDTVVVCPEQFHDALRPWLVYRMRQGHRISLISNRQSAEAIRRDIRKVATAGRLRNVLLVGDADPQAAADAESRARCVPTHLAKAKVNVRWGSEPEIATDNWFADLDDDNVPDVALGRLTADSNDELALMVSKILSYEQQAGHGAWRRRVNFVAGVGGFGKVVDSVLEMATKRFLTEGIPAAYQTSMTYGSWQSPFCPDPRRFHETAVNRMNEGCLFWVYIGHGQRQYLDRVQVPGGRFHILSTKDMDKVRCAEGSPIAIFLACYTGAFDHSRDCLAEEMLRTAGGPVAVFCGSRVTMPYAMSVMSNELLDEYFNKRPETLGEAVLNAKRRMVAAVDEQDKGQLSNRRLLDAIASVISPSASLLDAERAEHLNLFNLLGDPLMRLHHPAQVKLSTEKTTYSGKSLVVDCECELPGRCTIELVCRRDRTKFKPPTRAKFDGSNDALVAYQEIYRRANDTRWASQSLRVDGSPFRTELTIPDEANGACHVRVFVQGENDFAMGASQVFVRRPSKNE